MHPSPYPPWSACASSSGKSEPSTDFPPPFLRTAHTGLKQPLLRNTYCLLFPKFMVTGPFPSSLRIFPSGQHTRTIFSPFDFYGEARQVPIFFPSRERFFLHRRNVSSPLLGPPPFFSVGILPPKSEGLSHLPTMLPPTCPPRADALSQSGEFTGFVKIHFFSYNGSRKFFSFLPEPVDIISFTFPPSNAIHRKGNSPPLLVIYNSPSRSGTPFFSP